MCIRDQIHNKIQFYGPSKLKKSYGPNMQITSNYRDHFCNLLFKKLGSNFFFFFGNEVINK